MPTIDMLRTGEACIDSQGRLRLLSQDPRKRLSNTRAARHGRDNEEWVDALNARCFAEGIAYVHRVGTPYRIVSNDGARFTAVRTKAQGCDFRGVMLDGTNREVRVEAKAIAGERRFPLKEIRPSQRADLDACHRTGGIALVLLSFGPLLFAVPWVAVAEEIQIGTKSLSPVHLIVFRVGQDYLRRFAR